MSNKKMLSGLKGKTIIRWSLFGVIGLSIALGTGYINQRNFEKKAEKSGYAEWKETPAQEIGGVKYYTISASSEEDLMREFGCGGPVPEPEPEPEPGPEEPGGSGSGAAPGGSGGASGSGSGSALSVSPDDDNSIRWLY